MEGIIEFIKDNGLEIFGFIVGLLYLFWEYKADAKMWIASIIMPATGILLYFNKGIYADSMMNIYYLLIGIYGYWNWTRKQPDTKKTLPITHTPPRTAGMLVLAAMALWFLIALVLINFTDSTIPWIDAFTTSLAIIASWMGAKKYCEQWLVWLIIDLVTIPMQIYKGLVFYPCLYAAYSVIALFGYRNWLRLMRK